MILTTTKFTIVDISKPYNNTEILNMIILIYHISNHSLIPLKIVWWF